MNNLWKKGGKVSAIVKNNIWFILGLWKSGGCTHFLHSFCGEFWGDFKYGIHLLFGGFTRFAHRTITTTINIIERK